MIWLSDYHRNVSNRTLKSLNIEMFFYSRRSFFFTNNPRLQKSWFILQKTLALNPLPSIKNTSPPRAGVLYPNPILTNYKILVPSAFVVSLTVKLFSINTKIIWCFRMYLLFKTHFYLRLVSIREFTVIKNVIPCRLGTSNHWHRVSSKINLS